MAERGLPDLDTAGQPHGSIFLSRAGTLAPIFAVGGIALCLSIVGFGAGILLLVISALFAVVGVIGHYGLRTSTVTHSVTTRPRAIRLQPTAPLASLHHD